MAERKKPAQKKTPARKDQSQQELSKQLRDIQKRLERLEEANAQYHKRKVTRN